MIGRPYLYGLAAGGEAGVARALDILRAELETGMRLLGCNAVRDLNASYLRSDSRLAG
jgi:L-lactate dehydrogenase (cytochrome)